MNDIAIVASVALALSGISDYINMRRRQRGDERKEWIFVFALIAFLSIYGGLRTKFNDTGAYIHMFDLLRKDSFIGSSIDIGANPGFYALNVLFKRISENYHLMILAYTTFIQACFILFFRKYSKSLTLSVLIYIMSGAFVFTLAAIKQCLATALCLIATHFAIQRKYVFFVLFILIAVTIHPYAVLYLAVPLFLSKPWKTKTYLLLIVAAAVGFMFTEFLDVVLDLTQAIGEEYTEETLSGDGVNAIRVLVYAVPVVLSFAFRKDLYEDSSSEDNLMSNMTVLCFSLMFVALFGTANMFARLANYFNVFMMLSLPWMLMKLKTKFKPVLIYACGFFYTLYFYYAHYINIDFNAIFGRITLPEFIGQIF